MGCVSKYIYVVIKTTVFFSYSLSLTKCDKPLFMYDIGLYNNHDHCVLYVWPYKTCKCLNSHLWYNTFTDCNSSLAITLNKAVSCILL